MDNDWSDNDENDSNDKYQNKKIKNDYSDADNDTGDLYFFFEQHKRKI